MKMRRFFSVGLSVIVTLAQLVLPLARATASLPEPPEGLPYSRSSPPVPADSDPIVIPAIEDNVSPVSHTQALPLAPQQAPTMPATPAAATQAITVPLGTGNNNYGQTQRDTDNPQNHPGHHFAGPVNLVNGNFFLTVGDVFIPGRGLSLQLARSYNSLAAASGISGTFGYGWTHSYETQVISETGGVTLTVREADGSLHDYHSPLPCPDTPAYTCYDPPPGLYRQLRDMSGGGYLLMHKNGAYQQFNAEGQLVEIIDRDNNQINLYYNPAPICLIPGPPETLCAVWDTSGRRSLLFQYGTSGLVEVVHERLNGAPGRQTTYVYAGKDLVGVNHPEGGEVVYTYDLQHRLTAYNDPRQPEGVRHTDLIEYDGQNRVLTTTFHVDSFFDVTYDLGPEEATPEQGAVTAVVITDGAGQQIRVEFDSHANVVYEGDWFPDPGIWIGKWWWWHPRWWLLRSKVDANFHTTSYNYDAWGNTTVVTNALGAVQQFRWEEPFYEIIGTGIESYGNVLSATNSAGATTLYNHVYDATGDTLIEIQAPGTSEESHTIYQNDARGQLVVQIDVEAGLVAEYAYDEFGNTTVITDARGNATINKFDEVGRPIATTDQAGHTTTYEYDAADRLLSVIDPEGGTTHYTYSPDGRDNLVQLINANGVTTTYEYDGLDRLTTQTNSLSQTTIYEYDSLNRLSRRVDADGRATQYEYDAKSRMTKAEYYEVGAPTPYQINTYSYDPVGNLIRMENEHVRLSYEYDALDQRTRIDMWTPTWSSTRTLQLDRDPLTGNLTQLIGPAGYVVGYAYDSLNRLETVIDPDGGLTTYQYDLAGRLGNVNYPDGTIGTYDYNPTNHLTWLEYSLVDGQSISYTYDYDEQGNMISEVDESEIYTYTYDMVGRVLTSTSESQGDVSYEYDSVGNRLLARGPVSTTKLTYDAHSRMVQAGDATFTNNEMGARTEMQIGGGTMSPLPTTLVGSMDAAGEMQVAASVIRYQYDNDMRLIEVDPGLTFLYDPLGNLIGTVDGEGNHRYFLRDGEDIYLELDGNGDVVAQYVTGADGVLSMWRDGGRYLLLYDGRGRVRRAVDIATGGVVIQYNTDLNDPGSGPYYLYNPIRIHGAWWFPEASLVLFGEGVFWDPWFGTFLIKAWPWIYWPFGPFHPWRPIFRFWPWPWPWPRPWGWPWPYPWPYLWPWPGAWVRPWVIWPVWPWGLRLWWPWWYWRWWWGWVWWGRWWCWHPWWWWGKWWWWPWWHPWWWWGYWWFPWWWWWSCWWWPWYWWWWYWWWWPWWWPGCFWWCWWWWWPWYWHWWWPWTWPPILGPPEVGDAPDPPYPSYRYNRGATHGIWWYEWLGVWRDGEWDSDQIDADWYDDGMAVDLVAGTLIFTPTVANPGSLRYSVLRLLNVHGWFDWNSDGDWDDADEFIVNWWGYPGGTTSDGGSWPAGQPSLQVTQPFSIPDTVFNGSDIANLWSRFRLDYAANWQSPRDYTRFGEIEDHLITVVRPHRPPWDGQLIASPYVPLVITYTRIVTGIGVSITPTAAITPTWAVVPTRLAPQDTAAGEYGNQATIDHEPFTPGETYTLSLSGGVTYTGTEVVFPASFSFTAPCVELSDITIHGDTTGYPGVYTFTTSYEPVTASLPITYTWGNGDTTDTSTRTLDMGTHTLIVTATNCTSALVTDTHTIVIEPVCLTYVDYNWTPYYPDAGELVTFTISTILPITATPPFTYQWGFGDGGSAWGNPVTHTYAVSGTYWVSVTATNPCSIPRYMSHSIAVTGEPDITANPLTLNVALDPDETAVVTLTISNASTATADLAWSISENPPQMWLTAAPTNGVVPPAGSDDVEVTFDATSLDPGVYTTTLAVASNDPDEPLIDVSAVLTVNCIPVVDVDLIMTTVGTIYTDTVVYFSADVIPDNATKPYTYRLTIDGTPGSVMTSTADPLVLTDTFATTGIHTAEIAVWNCEMTEAQAVTDTLPITVTLYGVCVDLSSITIGGATMGYPGVYTFTTSYRPSNASLPISYIWDDEGKDATSVRTLDVGSHTLVVTATNCAAALVTDSHEIVISAAPVCTDVTDVSLIVTNVGTIYTDTVVTFSADVAPDDATKPYTFTVDYGTGPSTPASNSTDPLVFTHTFATVGTHVVTVSVWNCQMTSPATATVEVEVTEYGVCVDLTSITIRSGTLVNPGIYTFTTSYLPPNASLPISYMWDNGNTSHFSVRDLDVGTHTLTVTATNCTAALVTDTFTIVISGYNTYLPLVMRNAP